MRDDRELLELAARAHGGIRFDPMRLATVMMEVRTLREWNPLNDDGDALRLAVQCELEIAFDGDEEDGSDSSCSVGYPESTERPCIIKYVVEFHNKDIFAATRRAIVRAAAEIGRQITD